MTIAGSGAREDPIPIAGRCLVCGYEVAWQVFFGKPSTRTWAVRAFALITLIFVAAATMIRCAPSDALEDLRVQRVG